MTKPDVLDLGLLGQPLPEPSISSGLTRLSGKACAVSGLLEQGLYALKTTIPPSMASLSGPRR